MKKRKKIFSRETQTNNFLDVDFHEFMELVDHGYNTQEIASELGVSEKEVINLRNEINKEF